jgi:hypothetical protein
MGPCQKIGYDLDGKWSRLDIAIASRGSRLCSPLNQVSQEDKFTQLAMHTI